MEQAPSEGTVSLTTLLRFVDVATDALAEAREEVDALNVFPVPDGDTGTNMFLTMSAARDAVQAAARRDPENLAVAMKEFARGALLGARGNSGVILSQMIGAVTTRLMLGDPEQRVAALMAEAISEATNASYAAVGEPVEGTILSVARAASEAASARATHEQATAREVWSDAASAAHEALERTPEQLQALADAGVVDAGGRGLTVVLDAVATVLTGRRPPVAARGGVIPVPLPGDVCGVGPAFEVMYLLDAADDDVPGLRKRLAGLGDSLVVVGGEGLWNVHVHTDEVGAVIEAGIDAGRPHRIKVTHFAEPVTPAGTQVSTRTGRTVVAVTAGPGLAQLFEEAGASVVPGGPGARPSAAMVLEAITTSGRAEVVVLPNDPDSIRVSEIAARTAEAEHDIKVAVIHTETQVQGLAAMAVHEPGRAFHQDVLEMTATSRHVRHGAVTVAVKQAITMAGSCEPGQVLGVVAGDFAIVGDDLDEVAKQVLERLLAPGGELVTLVAGADDAGGLGERIAGHVQTRHPHVDVVVYAGGQDRYPLLMSVE